MLLFLILILAAVLILGGAYYGYRVAFYSPMKGREKIPSATGTQYEPFREEISRIFKQIYERPCEFVTITSHDGLTLSGRYYHVCDGAPLDIGFHGYRSCAFTDFAGGSELSFHMGHNLLLVDQRAHGRSQGRTITFGIQERLDVLSWVDYALRRFGPETRILLYGVSMGAATVLMASGLPLPENVKGIIADCPYSTPLDIILHVGKTYPLPQWLIRPFVILGAKIYGGFDLTETDAVKAVKDAKVPILVIHGENDGFVPCHMSDVKQANPALVERHTFPGADHALSYLVDTKRYWQIVMAFMERVLN